MKFVKFLRTKRYPHPDGPKRKPGTVMPITDELADRWTRNGLVELTERQLEEIAETHLDTFTLPELKEFATQLGVDLGKARTKPTIRAVIDQALADRANAGESEDEPTSTDPVSTEDPASPPAGEPNSEENPGPPAAPSNGPEGDAGSSD